MENKFLITATVDTNSADKPLGLEIWLDNKLLQQNNTITGSNNITVEVDDEEEAEHELKFVLKNKTPEHTKVDSDGNILDDTVVKISDLKFDGIELGHMFYEQAVYRHNFNGSGPETEDKFFGIMGCNGAVTLKFTTPMYLWLLENM
jgi:hypothetical protein